MSKHLLKTIINRLFQKMLLCSASFQSVHNRGVASAINVNQERGHFGANMAQYLYLTLYVLLYVVINVIIRKL